MTAQLNHTIVPARDKHAAAQFLATVLDVEVGKPVGPFIPVPLDNDVTLDYMDGDDVPNQHYAFLVDAARFDAARQRLIERGVQTWADPFREEPDQIYEEGGDRGFYFLDPSGHTMELLTPLGADPA